MSEKLKILIAGGDQAARDDLRTILAAEPDMEIAAEAAGGEEAVRKAKTLGPDIVLLDMNMPGMDGLAVAETLADMPRCLVMMYGTQWEPEYFRKAIHAGAKDYLVKPFAAGELPDGIRNLYAREARRWEKLQQGATEGKLGKVITVFSTKGGIGKTTISTNLAAALGLKKDKMVAIVDMDLQFGDVALFLNVTPKRTVADMVSAMHAMEKLDAGMLKSYMSKYQENIRVLTAPLRPEQAERVTVNYLADIFMEMKMHFDYIVVDMAPVFNDITFNILDLSDLIFIATSQDLPTLKNVKLCLDILQSLKYPDEKIKVVLNRDKAFGGLSTQDSEKLLQRKLVVTIPSDGDTVVTSVNKGVPFVLSSPETGVAQAIFNLASYVIYGDTRPYKRPVASQVDSRGMWSKLASIFKAKEATVHR